MKLKDREEYAEDDESLDMLQSFVMGTVAVRCRTRSLANKCHSDVLKSVAMGPQVTRELREDIEELQDKLILLTMGHDEREMAAVLKMHRNFRMRQAKKHARGKQDAIVRIQSTWRGHTERGIQQERHDAAKTIQL